MKKVMICALLTVAMVCCGTALFAQMQDGSSQGQGGMGRAICAALPCPPTIACSI